MKNKKDILKILKVTVDEFLYKTVMSSKLSEKKLFIILLNNSPKIPSSSEIVNYIIDRTDEDIDFFDIDMRACVIDYNNYIVMYELLKQLDTKIFTKEELQLVYSNYNNREIRDLVECKLWLFI